MSLYDVIPPGAIRDRKSKAIVFAKNENRQLKKEIDELKSMINYLVEKINKMEKNNHDTRQ